MVIGGTVTVFVLAMMFLVFGDRGIVDDGRYELRATFGKVDGLRQGGTVMTAGVPVGNVVSMELTSGFRTKVVMRVDRRVQLDREASAAIVTDGLFGVKFVSLDIGGADDLLGDGDEIGRTEDPQILDDLLNLIIATGQARARERASR